MDPTTGIDAHRQALSAAAAALTSLGTTLHSIDNPDLGELLSQVDALIASGTGVRAEVVLETVRRGIPGEAGMNTREWILEYAPSLRHGGAGQLARIVTEVVSRTAVTAGCDYDDPTTAVDRKHPLAIIWAQVRTGSAAAPLALTALTEIDKLRDRLYPDVVPTVTDALLTVGTSQGAAAMRQLKTMILATYGQPEEVDQTQRRLTQHAYLSSPMPESGDLTHYSMGLTPEQAARLEAALGPLSKPQPNPDTGEPDLRSNGQRRAEALLEITSRAASADAQRRGGPAESDTAVFVTISLTDLQAEAGAGEVIASRADGTLLSTATIRQMCCDADLIPTVLDAKGQILDHGMTVRFFTRAQRRAIWRRDRRCTYPGCTAPAGWTRVHHVQHWADNGPTDLDNAALLCQRHHSHVHSKRLWAEVHAQPDESGRHVHWDLTEGSYDYQLRIRGGSPPRRPAPARSARPPGPSRPPGPAVSSRSSGPPGSARSSRPSGPSRSSGPAAPA